MTLLAQKIKAVAPHDNYFDKRLQDIKDFQSKRNARQVLTRRAGIAGAAAATAGGIYALHRSNKKRQQDLDRAPKKTAADDDKNKGLRRAGTAGIVGGVGALTAGSVLPVASMFTPTAVRNAETFFTGSPMQQEQAYKRMTSHARKAQRLGRAGQLAGAGLLAGGIYARHRAKKKTAQEYALEGLQEAIQEKAVEDVAAMRVPYFLAP